MQSQMLYLSVPTMPTHIDQHHPSRAPFPSNLIDIIIEPEKNIGGLYLTGIKGAIDAPSIQNLNIEAVLTIGIELQNLRFHNIEHKIIPVYDWSFENIEQYFQEAIDFIDVQRSKGKSVLVHCFVGVSRSVTIVLAYLMSHRRITLQQAYSLVKSKRPLVNPNQGFLNQLASFEQKLMSNKTQQRSQDIKISQYLTEQRGSRYTSQTPNKQMIQQAFQPRPRTQIRNMSNTPLSTRQILEQAKLRAPIQKQEMFLDPRKSSIFQSVNLYSSPLRISLPVQITPHKWNFQNSFYGTRPGPVRVTLS